MVAYHVPVLVEAVLDALDPEPGRLIVDGTVGGGGHAAKILERILPGGLLIGLDIDNDAVQTCSDRFKDRRDSVLIVRDNYANLPRVLRSLRLEAVDGILLDLGVSSHQVDVPERGFSFLREGPLDMRMSQAYRTTAADIVNTWSRRDLERIFRELGEERFAGRIANAIVASRPLRTTTQLADLVARTVPRKPKGIHPATRVFQALRIAVNHELDHLAAFLRDGYRLLRPQGRMVVIAYHSLEDRLVKAAFRRWAASCLCPPPMPVCSCGWSPQVRILTSKPVTPSAQEVMVNPRARSARLRAVERCAAGGER